MPNTQTPQPHKHSGVLSDDRPVAPTPVFARILCAIDGTRGSTATARMAATLSGPNGHLTLLAVTAASSAGPDAMAVLSRSRAQRTLDRAKRIAEAAGVPCTMVLDPAGPPVEVILERASDHDLLAIGAPHISWLAGMLIGRVSSSLGGMVTGGVTAAALGRLTTPLLVVRAPSSSSSNRHTILVASDGEAGSDQLVELAGRLAQSQGANVTLVNALVAESKMNPRAIQAQANALKETLPDAGEPWIEPGKAWDVLLDAAKSTKATLVVIGSRRLDGVRALGSVSRRVVHDAPCSVLVVPPHEDPTPGQARKGDS